MRVLIIALHFAPDQVSGGYETTAVAEELARRGHQVTVVTAFPFHKEHRIEPPFRGKLWSHDYYGDHGEIQVHRVWLYLGRRKDRVGGRLLSYASFNVTSTTAALLCGRYDVVVTPSPPLTNGIAAYLYGALYRTPVVFNVRDVYPDVAVQLGLLRGRWTIRVFQLLERFIYQHAAKVVVLTDRMAANLEGKGFGPKNVAIIPHSVDTERIRPLPRDNAYARRHGLHDKFVAMYAGNIGLAQGLETALDAAALLFDLPQVRIVLVGSGAARATLEAATVERGLKNVLFLPFTPRDEAPLMHASADVGLSLLRRGVAQFAMPAKLYSVMASGRAVLLTAEADTPAARLISESRCGVVVPPEQPQALAAALRALATNPAASRSIGARGRDYVIANYSKQAIGGQYHALLAQLHRARL